MRFSLRCILWKFLKFLMSIVVSAGQPKNSASRKPGTSRGEPDSWHPRAFRLKDANHGHHSRLNDWMWMYARSRTGQHANWWKFGRRVFRLWVFDIRYPSTDQELPCCLNDWGVKAPTCRTCFVPCSAPFLEYQTRRLAGWVPLKTLMASMKETYSRTPRADTIGKRNR